MGLLDLASLSWLVPSAYAFLVSLGYLYAYLWRRGWESSSSTAGIKKGGLSEPLLNAEVGQDGGEEEFKEWEDLERFRSGKQQQHPLAATGMLWATLTLSYILLAFHAISFVLGVASITADSPLSNGCLTAAWLVMIICRNADHWWRASSLPESAVCMKMNLWLWPFYNLAFVLSLLALLSEHSKENPGSVSVDDLEIWASVVRGLCLLSATHSLLRGASIEWLEDPINDEFSTGLFGAAFFGWFTKVIWKGQKKQLDLDDLPKQMSQDRSKNVWTRMDAAPSHCSLLYRLYLLVRPIFWAQGVWQFIAVVSELSGPLAMQQIVDFISNYKSGDKITSAVNFFVALLFLGPLVQSICDARNFHIGRRIGCRVRSALVNAVFRKMLRTDMSDSKFSSGELTNLMSVDAQSALEMAPYMHFIWTTSLQIVVCVAVLFYVIGVASLGGVAFMVLSVPVGKWATSRQQKNQKELMVKKDARMGVVGETLQGMRIVKLFGWETHFLHLIKVKRLDEMSVLRRYMILMAGILVQWNSVTTLVGLCTFLVHTRVLGRELSASQGFTALSLFNILQFPLLVLPDVLNFLFQSYVSLKRVENFLDRDEIEGFDASNSMQGNGPPGTIQVSHASFSWGHPPPILNEEQADGSAGLVARAIDDEEGSRTPLVSIDANSDPEPWPVMYGESEDGESFDVQASSSLQSAFEDSQPLLPPLTSSSSTTGSASVPAALKVTLTDISFSIQPGQLACIYGATGGGKSSLLLGILGEIRKLSGSVSLNGSVAYCSQRAWIQNATVRDNITFGLPFEETRYSRAVEATALATDFSLLEHGDLTEIGEKGINLSGGQQQRIALARALYSDADIYLLDDVLSAVDAHVGEHIFRKCIRHELIKRGKTVVLVSHSIPLTARYADQVIIIDRKGTIAESGSPIELMDSPGSMLSKLVRKVGGGEERLRRQSSEILDDLPGEAGDQGKPRKGHQGDVDTRLVKDEERARGAPGLTIYLAYCNACGGVLKFLVPYLVLHVSYNLLQFGQNLGLSNWVSVLEDEKPDSRAMWLYIIVSVGTIGVVFARSLFQSLASLRASVYFHDSMAARIMRAPMSWFETTPTGRILNRFSSDIQDIDKNTMEEFGNTFASVFSLLSILLVISWTVPYIIIGLVPFSALSFVFGQLYLSASRELKRLDSVTKSPIYGHFTESVNGVSTIRAYAAQSRFIDESGRRVDLCNSAHLNLWVSNRWFNIRVQLIGGIISFLVGAFLVYWGKDHIPAETSGLCLLYALQYTDAIKYLVRTQATLEMKMNSVERALEYMRVPQEKAAVMEHRRPPLSWPSEGEIVVKNLTLQYPSSSTPVIRDISFTIQAGMKVGIVGRTGAGKSSLCSVIFRIVEPREGSSIVIDGQDVLAMGLEDLRKRLSIVPQDPILFQGTIRSNLDPFSERSDVELWEALRQAHLVPAIESLSEEVSENGSNYSVGQRQLLCMARALIRGSKVLFLDEATASIDLETDAGIQDMIKNGFEGATIVTIAHRIATIVYYDRVMVMDKGELCEYASPRELLQDENSMFYSLCSKTGALDELKAIANGSAKE